MNRSGVSWAAEFACAARGYWLAVFPRARSEMARSRALAERIPDPALRRLALQALERKGANLEGAAAFAILAPRPWRPHAVRGLVACQALCDYLDILCEQPSPDPVSAGYELHENLRDAFSPTSSRQGARLRARRADGHYLGSLVEAIRGALASLPSQRTVARALERAVQRTIAYQALNHGDSNGSNAPFEQWARRQSRAFDGRLRWWETGAGAGSTLGLHVLIGVAAEPRLSIPELRAVESAYYPWVGALHSLLDSLVDRGEDHAMGAPGLIDRYASAAQAGERMRLIAREALERTTQLPRGKRHTLIVTAMTCFYLCDLRGAGSTHAPLVAPPLLQELGAIAAPNMAVLRMRRLLGWRATPASPLLPAVSGPVKSRLALTQVEQSRKSSI
jgi:tetraprenyl-beta-curcumene synthase